MALFAPPMHEPIEADSDRSENFSDYESVRSDTTSVNSSVFDYTFENGRRYHAYRAGQYLLPNDEQEQDRLDLQHHIFQLALGGELSATKLRNPQCILDAGTGTGIWAMEAGDAYPSATVHGVDLSPIQPKWVPPNVVFEIDDLTQEWTYPSNFFDFIHVRTLGGSIKDWVVFLKEAFEHLKPGGRIEVSEIRTHFHCDDGTFPKDCYSKRWEDTFHEIARTIGLEFDQIPLMQGWFREAGFINVDQVDRLIPVGMWPRDRRMKEIGKYYQVHLLEGGMENYTMALFTRNGWAPEEVQALLAHVRSEIKSNKMHTYTKACFVMGQKPGGSADHT